MSLLPQPWLRALDDNGRPIAGAQLFAYVTGTTTSTDIFTDAALTTPCDIPHLADANGYFNEVYYVPSVQTRIVIKRSTGEVVTDTDPVNEGSTLLPDASVTAAKIADNAVTSSKIAAQAVSNDKLSLVPPRTVKGNALQDNATPIDLTSAMLLDILGDILAGSIFTTAYSFSDTAYALFCDGRAVSRTTYSRLFGRIGTLYGVGDGSTTFNIPDARACVVRAPDRGKGISVGHDIAEIQTDAIQNVTGEAGVVFDGTFSGPFAKGAAVGSFSAAGANAYKLLFDLSTASGVRTASETRVRGIGFDMAIFI